MRSRILSRRPTGFVAAGNLPEANVVVHGHPPPGADLSLALRGRLRALRLQLFVVDLGLVVERGVRLGRLLEGDELGLLLEVRLGAVGLPARPGTLLHEVFQVRLPRGRGGLGKLVRVVRHPLLRQTHHLAILALLLADLAGLGALSHHARDVRGAEPPPRRESGRRLRTGPTRRGAGAAPAEGPTLPARRPTRDATALAVVETALDIADVVARRVLCARATGTFPG